MVTLGIGKNLLNATLVLKAATTQIEELFAEFGNHLSGLTTHEGVGFRISKGQPEADYFWDGWSQDAWRLTLHATDGGKRARKGYEHGEVSLVVDLGRSGWLAQKIGEACLYVFWAGREDSWVGQLDGDDDISPTDEDYVIADGKIFLWRPMEDRDVLAPEDFQEAPMETSWFFAVPLAAVDSRRKVHDVLARPIFDLVNGSFEGLGNDHPAFEFEWRDGKPALKDKSNA